MKMSFSSFHDCNVGFHANALRVVQLGLLTYAGFLCKTSKTWEAPHDYICLCKWARVPMWSLIAPIIKKNVPVGWLSRYLQYVAEQWTTVKKFAAVTYSSAIWENRPLLTALEISEMINAPAACPHFCSGYTSILASILVHYQFRPTVNRAQCVIPPGKPTNTWDLRV